MFAEIRKCTWLISCLYIVQEICLNIINIQNALNNITQQYLEFRTVKANTTKHNKNKNQHLRKITKNSEKSIVHPLSLKAQRFEEEIPSDL